MHKQLFNKDYHQNGYESVSVDGFLKFASRGDENQKVRSSPSSILGL